MPKQRLTCGRTTRSRSVGTDTMAAQNSDLLVAYPHTLVGVGAILAVQGEARAHPNPR